MKEVIRFNVGDLICLLIRGYGEAYLVICFIIRKHLWMIMRILLYEPVYWDDRKSFISHIDEKVAVA